MAENKLITIKKNIKGSLYLVLDDYYGEKQTRTFALTPDRPEIHIPLSFALSIFNNHVTKRMYDQGKFIFTKNMALLTATLREEFLLQDEEGLPSVKSDDEIIKELNEGKAEELLSGPLQEKVFDVASANTEKLSFNAVNKIEEVTKLALTEE